MRARAPIAVLTLVVSALLAPVLIGNVHAFGCNLPGCQFTVDTNVANTVGTVFVELDNSTSPLYALPHTFTFLNNSIHTIQVLNLTFSQSSTGAQYVWKQWSDFGQPWTSNTMMRTQPIYNNYTGPASFIAQFDKQFKLSLTFTDPSGQAINPPSSVTLTSGPSTATLTSYSNQWMSANVWSVSTLTWEGSLLQPTSTQTIDLTGGTVTKAIPLPAYPETLQVVDNNNNPISGANVTVTFANRTSTSFLSDSKGRVNLGHIPNGLFSANVLYQNQHYGPWSLTAVSTPTNTLQLNVGSSASATTVSAIVLLTIFGLAFFLILLAIKVRKPPLPPTI